MSMSVRVNKILTFREYSAVGEDERVPADLTELSVKTRLQIWKVFRSTTSRTLVNRCPLTFAFTEYNQENTVGYGR